MPKSKEEVPFYDEPNYLGCADSKMDSKRLSIFKKQIAERGFDDSELWNLDYTFAKFMLPRLKSFIEMKACCHPASIDEVEDWENILKKMVKALKLVIKDLDGELLNEKERKQKALGLRMFVEYLHFLWV